MPQHVDEVAEFRQRRRDRRFRGAHPPGACLAALCLTAVACGTAMGLAAAMAPTAAASAGAGAGVAGTAAVASGGTWGTAVLVPGSAGLNKGGFANVNSVSCGAAGDCVAAGSYADTLDDQAFVAVERAGRWRAAREVPGVAALNKFSANALSVSCASAGNCAVGGFYERAGQDSEAFVASEVRGVWRRAAPVRGP